MKIYICKVCGHIEFNNLPDFCPVCHAPKTSFIQNDKVFIESAEKSKEAAVKHIPEIQVEKVCGLVPEGCTDVHVRIGKTLHPMEEKHFIQFADCYVDYLYVERIHFTPRGVNPACCFHLKKDSGKITIVENCNIHGYWQSETTI